VPHVESKEDPRGGQATKGQVEGDLGLGAGLSSKFVRMLACWCSLSTVFTIFEGKSREVHTIWTCLMVGPT